LVFSEYGVWIFVRLWVTGFAWAGGKQTICNGRRRPA